MGSGDSNTGCRAWGIGVSCPSWIGVLLLVRGLSGVASGEGGRRGGGGDWCRPRHALPLRKASVAAPVPTTWSSGPLFERPARRPNCRGRVSSIGRCAILPTHRPTHGRLIIPTFLTTPLPPPRSSPPPSPISAPFLFWLSTTRSLSYSGPSPPAASSPLISIFIDGRWEGP